jgi:hypothetical protein
MYENVQLIYFYKKHHNNETVECSWLRFSPNTGKVYCYICELVATQRNKLSSSGFCDWKHASVILAEHEISKFHLESVKVLVKRGKELGRIDHDLAKKEAEWNVYWCKNLRRVVSVVKFIAERGLALRGDNEMVGSQRNGNYLGIIELIEEYNTFLSAHIKLHASKGIGHTNYLSSTIFEEVIGLMGEHVLKEIISRIKKSKYYSMSVDSTPDEAVIDQLTIVI